VTSEKEHGMTVLSKAMPTFGMRKHTWSTF